MDLSPFQSIGYGTAVAVMAIVAATAIFRRWRKEDKKREEINDLKAKYRAAVDSRDLELASAISLRLRDLEAEAK